MEFSLTFLFEFLIAIFQTRKVTHKGLENKILSKETRLVVRGCSIQNHKWNFRLLFYSNSSLLSCKYVKLTNEGLKSKT